MLPFAASFFLSLHCFFFFFSLNLRIVVIVVAIHILCAGLYFFCWYLLRFVSHSNLVNKLEDGIVLNIAVVRCVSTLVCQHYKLTSTLSNIDSYKTYHIHIIHINMYAQAMWSMEIQHFSTVRCCRRRRPTTLCFVLSFIHWLRFVFVFMSLVLLY